MRNRQIFATLLAAMFILGFSAVALAGGANCSANKDASTASAAGCNKDASATTVSAGACAKSAATATTASASGCSSAASAACAKSAGHGVAMETVRMPSGALAIFYRGMDEATVASLQNGAHEKGANFGCVLAGAVAANQNCQVEIADIEGGIMLLVTSDQAEQLDEIEAQYAVAAEAHAAQEEGAGE